MIKEVEIKNFKSIKEARVCFTDNLNLVVGLNGAGKTNLIKAIGLIKNLTTGSTLEETVAEMMLSSAELFFQQDTSKDIFLRTMIEGQEKIFSYEVVIESVNQPKLPNIRIKQEKLCEVDRDLNEETVIFTREQGNLVKDKSGEPIKVQVANNQSFCFYQEPSIVIFREIIKNVNIIDAYTVNLSKLNTLARYDDPSTLTSVIVKLKHENPQKFKVFEDSLKKLLPSLSGITDLSSGENQDPQSDKVFLLLFEQIKLAGKLSFKSLSDGDVRTIMIILNAVLLGENSTLIIEEIENALHPHRVKSIIDHLKKNSYANNLQVIFSTHSPMIIDNISPDEIIYVQRKNGLGSQFTHFKEAEYSSKIQKVLKEGGNLSEFLESIV